MPQFVALTRSPTSHSALPQASFTQGACVRRAVGIAALVLAATVAITVSKSAGASSALLQTPLSPDAQAKHAHALAERAVRHEHGEGVERNPELAAALYCEAARLGNSDSAYALAWMYANGRGIPRNDAFAAALLARLPDSHAQGQVLARHLNDAPAVPACLSTPDALFANSEWNRRGLDLNKLRPDQRQIADLVRTLAPQYQVNADFALAIALAESAFNPRAVSPKNAQGVMQLIPATAERFQVRDAFDPQENIKGGLRYLQWLLAYFEGDVMLASAAYNAGERAVERHRGVPPYQETQAYVKKIMALIPHQAHPYDPKLTSPSPFLADRQRRDGAPPVTPALASSRVKK